MATILYGLEIPRWRYAYRGYNILRPGSPAKAQAPQAGNFSLIFFQRIRQWFDAQAAGIVAHTEHAVQF
ncbi:hypothetical protein LAN30_23390, partial [Mycobacterium tuberculosis]|nr:hypothetical protein [Mycobacterium tuberculosis]